MNRNQQFRQDMTFRDVCLAMLRHRKKAMAVFLLVMTATVVITLLTPKAYISESKLFVRLGRENAMLDPSATLGEDAVVAIPQSRESEINSVAEMLSSRAILESVVDDVGPETILDGLPQAPSRGGSQTAGFTRWMEQTGTQVRGWGSTAVGALKQLVSASDLTARDLAIEQLGEELAVGAVRNTNVIVVSYKASQPELAQRVVASIVDAYLEQHVRLNRTGGTHEFFAEHTERLGEDLKNLEDELGELKTTTGLASVDQQRGQIVDRIGHLEDDLLGVEAARSEAEAKVRALQEQLAELPKEQVTETSTGIGNTGTDMIREQFFSLQVQEKEASAIYTADHPKLQMIRTELAEAERILGQQEPTRTQVTMSPDITFEQARSALAAEQPQLASLEAKSTLLQHQLAELKESLQTLNANEIQIARLQREIELREADYRKYATNLEQTRIDQAMEAQHMSNINVVQSASLEPRAVRPRKALNLAIGLVAAIFSAFSVTMLAEYFDRSFHTPDDVERNLGVPTLVSIPRMSRKALKINGGKCP